MALVIDRASAGFNTTPFSIKNCVVSVNASSAGGRSGRSRRLPPGEICRRSGAAPLPQQLQTCTEQRESRVNRAARFGRAVHSPMVVALVNDRGGDAEQAARASLAAELLAARSSTHL